MERLWVRRPLAAFMAVVAQRAEPRPGTTEGSGSNPVDSFHIRRPGSTGRAPSLYLGGCGIVAHGRLSFRCDRSSAGRASLFQSDGRGFDSRRSLFPFGPVAKWQGARLQPWMCWFDSSRALLFLRWLRSPSGRGAGFKSRSVKVRILPELFTIYKGGATCPNSTLIKRTTAFEPMSKRRRGFPSETNVKLGEQIVHGNKELIEKLGRNDPCPCGSGKCF